jgi:hypothetical protein
VTSVAGKTTVSLTLLAAAPPHAIFAFAVDHSGVRAHVEEATAPATLEDTSAGAVLAAAFTQLAADADVGEDESAGGCLPAGAVLCFACDARSVTVLLNGQHVTAVASPLLSAALVAAFKGLAGT